MDKIKISVNGNIASVTEKPAKITSGTVGLIAEFTFDSAWEGMAKSVVFRAGLNQVLVECLENTAVVPWAILTEPGYRLFVGVYGVNADGSVAIASTMANVCTITPGSTPYSSDTEKELHVWVKGERGERGLQGEKGDTPVRGVDYFTDEDKAYFVNAVLDALPSWEGGSY